MNLIPKSLKNKVSSWETPRYLGPAQQQPSSSTQPSSPSSARSMRWNLRRVFVNTRQRVQPQQSCTQQPSPRNPHSDYTKEAGQSLPDLGNCTMCWRAVWEALWLVAESKRKGSQVPKLTKDGCHCQAQGWSKANSPWTSAAFLSAGLLSIAKAWLVPSFRCDAEDALGYLGSPDRRALVSRNGTAGHKNSHAIVVVSTASTTPQRQRTSNRYLNFPNNTKALLSCQVVDTLWVACLDWSPGGQHLQRRMPRLRSAGPAWGVGTAALNEWQPNNLQLALGRSSFSPRQFHSVRCCAAAFEVVLQEG